MATCNDFDEDIIPRIIVSNPKPTQHNTITCSSCGNNIQLQDQGGVSELPKLPARVKFDSNDQEILQHLEAKVIVDVPNLHSLIDEFIPTLEGENDICYTHPENLPGVSKDGQVRHFFHTPPRAYTTGTRKRRKIETDEKGSETRWHQTRKTKTVYIGGTAKGFKKILVLYTNHGRQKKSEKTNWVMHQYHLGSNEKEKDVELVVSKVFYQTQYREHGGGSNNSIINDLYENKALMISHPIVNDDNHEMDNKSGDSIDLNLNLWGF